MKIYYCNENVLLNKHNMYVTSFSVINANVIKINI